MTRTYQRIWRDRRGASAVEFALTIPVLLTMIIGILQLGMLFQAKAGLQQAVESGARYATIYPNPSDTAITAKISASRFGLKSAYITGPTLTHGTTADGVKYVDVSMSYAFPVNLIMFRMEAVTLSHSRRAYQP